MEAINYKIPFAIKLYTETAENLNDLFVVAERGEISVGVCGRA